jgi:hypothetical protein
LAKKKILSAVFTAEWLVSLTKATLLKLMPFAAAYLLEVGFSWYAKETTNLCLCWQLTCL